MFQSYTNKALFRSPPVPVGASQFSPKPRHFGINSSSICLQKIRKWFEPRSNIPVVCDWRFDHLCGSHLQSQVQKSKFKNPGKGFAWSIDREAFADDPDQKMRDGRDWYKNDKKHVFLFYKKCEVIYEMFHILNCGFWNQVSCDHRSYERNFKQLRIEAWKSQEFNGV